VALGQEVAPQAIGDLGRIDLVVLLLGCGNGPQHKRVRDLHLLGMRKQMVVNPAGEDRRFHGDHPGLRQSPDPHIKLASGRTDLALLQHTTSRVLHAITDRLLVHIQSDVIHIVSEEPPRLFSGSASTLSPAFCNTSRSSST